jgi:hypothetical protein
MRGEKLFASMAEKCQHTVERKGNNVEVHVRVETKSVLAGRRSLLEDFSAGWDLTKSCALYNGAAVQNLTLYHRN